MASSSSNRQFSHRNANTFLTYPKCPENPEIACQMIWELVVRWIPKYILCAREAHKDGSLHLHALLQTEKPVRISDSRFFDINGFHPNIQSAKSVNRVRDYILKEPLAVFERGTFIPRKSPFLGKSDSEVKEKKPSKDEIMRDIISHATSKEEYLSMIQKELPFDWSTKLQYFDYSANKLFPEIQEAFTNPHPPSSPDLLCNESINDWLQPNIFQSSDERSRKQSLYIVGPTRTGKSTWARSLGVHNYWQNNVDWSSYNEDAIYNIVDDIPFKFCPCWKQLVGCQRDFIVNPKYGKKKKVQKKSKPTIILANSDEDWMKEMTPGQLEYFEANCVIYIMSPGEKWYSPPELPPTEAVDSDRS
uniref:Replication-associated protein n=1 Tax=Maize streak virus TaxID=10821 RepID=A0A1P8W443_9GEMI|nr:replication associated protein [Maize streak virus]